MDNQTSQTDGLNPQEQEGQQQGNEQGTEQVTPGQQQGERLYAGRFKTPEELEEAYKHSSTEGQRLNQRMRQLEQQLSQARTPAQKEAIQDKIDDLGKYFDKDTAHVLSTWFKQQMAQELSNFRNSFRGEQSFQSQVSESWNETLKLYPEVANPQSKLYIRANEILFERGLAQVDENGQVQLITPHAYRMAVEAAAEELHRQSPEVAENQQKKGLAGKIQGKGSNVVPKGKLTRDQYMLLSDEEKDAYDMQQMAQR